MGNHRTGMESSVKLLSEILSDYPRIWNFYKQDNGEKTRTPKFAQRYPLPIGTLSMIMDFHKWVHESCKLTVDVTGIQLSQQIRKLPIGPDPVIMYRLNWLGENWNIIQHRDKIFARNLGNEILGWHTKIRVKVNDGDIYSYQTEMRCHQCSHRSVVRMNDEFICVNVACKNPISGEWLKWQQ